MKKMLSSFVVTGVLTVGNISAIASEYITNTVDIITQIDSKEKIKKNPIVANRAIYMANPCHIIDKVVPI